MVAVGVYRTDDGFTLIELSIVLVIIGLVAGGVLVGQDLVRAARERAQVSQIERFNSAVNTFRSKYGALPGDMDRNAAANFGFAPRPGGQGLGDNNGLLEGKPSSADSFPGFHQVMGETDLIWNDLVVAGLVDQGSSQVRIAGVPDISDAPTIATFFPAAKIGRANLVIAYSYNSVNYWQISNVTFVSSNAIITTSPGLTVKEAADIDAKLDDGLPQTGNITAVYISYFGAAADNIYYANGQLGTNGQGNMPLSAGKASKGGTSTTCMDNNSVNGAILTYSMKISGGSNVTCALSFRFQ